MQGSSRAVGIHGLRSWVHARYRRTRHFNARAVAALFTKIGPGILVAHLPDLGIHGNTDFPFSDTNNLEIANRLSKFLAEQQLDAGTVR